MSRALAAIQRTPVYSSHRQLCSSTRPACCPAAAKEEGAEKSEEEKKREEAAQAYTKFYTAFGKSLKMGVIEDTSNRWAPDVGLIGSRN